jgi:hypothetical protein
MTPVHHPSTNDGTPGAECSAPAQLALVSVTSIGKATPIPTEAARTPGTLLDLLTVSEVSAISKRGDAIAADLADPAPRRPTGLGPVDIQVRSNETRRLRRSVGDGVF